MATFPRKNRLTRPEEFRRVFQRGRHRRIQVEGILCRARESSTSHARLGLAISKRSLKRAVDRNRVKRLVREGFRTHFTQLPAVDIVIMGETKLASMDNAVILQQLGMLWERLDGYYNAANKPPRQTPSNHKPD
ncbi:MAG: ribonuclease P protein component [Thiolinea sp.]